MSKVCEYPVGTAIPGDAMVALREKLRLQAGLRRGADWFICVAGLSALDTVMLLSGSSFHLVFGLGLAHLTHRLARGFAADAAAASVALLLISLLIVGWMFGRRAHAWAFVAGIAVYGVDALPFAIDLDILPLAFHAIALYAMVRGMVAVRRLATLPVVAERAQTTAHGM